MKPEFLELLGIDAKRLFALAAVVAIATAAAAGMLFGGVLGQASVEFEAVLSALVFYAVVSAPRRSLEARRIAQAREAVMLSVVATVSSAMTGSRARTILMLRAKEAGLAHALAEAKKLVLLGHRAEDAVVASVRALPSYSAADVLTAAALTRPTVPWEGGEEAKGLASSAQLAEETKFPIFMTACFFSPIILLLYSVLAHIGSAEGLAEVVGLQLLIVDLAYYLCAKGGRVP